MRAGLKPRSVPSTLTTISWFVSVMNERSALSSTRGSIASSSPSALAAVIATTAAAWWHVTTDVLAEGLHFDMTSAGPESIGYRAAMANLSDIAAMGATPRFLLVSLAIPKKLNQSYIYKVYEGLMKACRRHDTTLIGGDNSASRNSLFVNIILIGSTMRRRALFRHGAKVGDQIYVSGTLGDSHAGLRLLASQRTA